MKRILKTMAVSALALPFMLGAGVAKADVLDSNKVGSALALVYMTEDDEAQDTVTSIIVTNTSATDEIVLAVELIDGDSDGDWNGQSFRCPMTPGETTQFFFAPSSGDADEGPNAETELTYECSIPGSGQFDDPEDLSLEKTMIIDSDEGIMWVTVEGVAFPNPTLSKNVLEGKSTILDFEDGSAIELAAVPFQSPMPEAQDFDKEYEFDGMELAQMPESLTASFYAPEDNDVETELILFTLDGRLSSAQNPNAEAVVYFFNDDEEFFNTSLAFDCFVVVDLEDIDSRFIRDNLGSQVGHLEIIPQSVDPNDENHDAMFGNDDNKRYVPILGWIVHEFEREIENAHGDDFGTMQGTGSTGSLLSTSMNPLPAESNDVPALKP